MTSAPPATPALAIRGLTKTFGDRTVVKGIDLDIPAGSFYGLVGPMAPGRRRHCR